MGWKYRGSHSRHRLRVFFLLLKPLKCELAWMYMGHKITPKYWHRKLSRGFGGAGVPMTRSNPQNLDIP
jgi:hypothetical protein